MSPGEIDIDSPGLVIRRDGGRPTAVHTVVSCGALVDAVTGAVGRCGQRSRRGAAMTAARLPRLTRALPLPSASRGGRSPRTRLGTARRSRIDQPDFRL